MFPRDYSVSDFQQWVCERIRESATEDEKAGWVRVDAWVHRRIAALSTQCGHAIRTHDCSAYHLVEGFSDE